MLKFISIVKMNAPIKNISFQKLNLIKELKYLYKIKKDEITQNLKEFKRKMSEATEEEIFAELAFCILTPQSKAKQCWEAIIRLTSKNLLFKGNANLIKKELYGVRFKNKKANYIIKARKLFNKLKIKTKITQFENVQKCREWLVKNIVGMGYKEASHFLRNIGLGEEIAILDRHVLRNLSRLGVIKQIPTSINKKQYLQIEKKFKKFAKQINIPISYLDLLFWYKETGEIFK